MLFLMAVIIQPVVRIMIFVI